MLSSRTSALMLFAFLTGGVTPPVLARDLLEEVTEAHRAAVQSIRTFSCKVRVTPAGASRTPGETGEYWRSSDGVRVCGKVGDTEFDAVQREGLVRTIGTVSIPGRAAGRGGAITPAKGRALPGCSVWEYALFLFPGPKKDFTVLPFDELLQKPHRLKNVSRRKEEGADYVVVEYSQDGENHFEAWFDPQVNCLVRRFVVRDSGRDLSGMVEHRILAFKEVVPGIFFPERVESYLGEKRRAIRTVSFADIRVNQPIPQGKFDLRFPRGMLVRDTVQGKSYEVDGDGNLVAGTMKDLPRPPAPPLPTSAATGSLGPTLREPRSWSAWILPASLGVILLGVALWVRRKWYLRRAS